jgi:hypothetical protein
MILPRLVQFPYRIVDGLAKKFFPLKSFWQLVLSDLLYLQLTCPLLLPGLLSPTLQFQQAVAVPSLFADVGSDLGAVHSMNTRPMVGKDHLIAWPNTAAMAPCYPAKTATMYCGPGRASLPAISKTYAPEAFSGRVP